MPTRPFTALACPLDGHPLRREGSSWHCPDGHCYDIARQGYTHLLPVQNKRSRDPGDSKEMVAARRRFLASGHYAPIADLLGRHMQAILPNGGACLDAGCGEGYYLSQLANTCAPTHARHLLGLDISKWAIQAAARRTSEITWVVGSNARLPVLTGTLDAVLCLFGFPVYPEFARVLKPGGHLLQIDAGTDHLRELREIIYPVLNLDNKPPPAQPAGFTLSSRETLRFVVELTDQESIADVLVMTPHMYRAPPEGRARAAALNALRLTAEVQISCWQRANDAPIDNNPDF